MKVSKFQKEVINNPVEVYIISKKSGLLLLKYTIVNVAETSRDQLMSGFLVALRDFAKEMDFPEGVTLIRSGNLEARYSSGNYVFAALIIRHPHNQSTASTEPILSGLASEIVSQFEKRYEKDLEKQSKSQKFTPKTFVAFQKEIDKIIDQFSDESHELYQKLVLIEAMYANVPQKWCLPLIKKIGNGKTVNIIDKVPEMYHRRLKKAVKKVNYNSNPVWQIFVVPLIDPNLL
ncbi:MAG: hypothetical protein EU541_05915 [Promethearchaeota archaeon]|nr:MAG: hypothetical protein EU541_05915 [Candidatus Lokiarchaeota archaeon]